MAGCLQPGYAIDQKARVVDEMFLAEFREEHLGQCRGSGREQSHVQQAIRARINRRKQPVALVVHSNYGLINRDVIRVAPSVGCRLAF